MKSFNTLYQNKEQLINYLTSHSLNHGKNCLVRIHTAYLSQEESLKIAKEVKAILPQCEIIGCATSGNAIGGEIIDKGALISIIQFEYGQFKSQMFTLKRKDDKELINNLVAYAKDYDASLGFLFFGNIENKVTQIIEGICNELPEVSFLGGVAGYLGEDGTAVSYVFTDEEVLTEGFVTALIKRDFVLAYTNIINGHPPISDIHTITKIDGTYVLEIDYQDAVAWINKQLGIKELHENSNWESSVSTDILLRFPIVLEEGNGATRFFQYDASSNRLQLYFSELNQGTKFRIGYLSSLNSVEQWQEVHQELQTISSEVVTGYSCLFRKLFADNISKWEINAFKGTNFTGSFLLGEIGTKDGRCAVLNGSCSIATLAEKENYLEFNLDAFSSIDGLANENDELLSQIELVQETLNEQNDGSFLKSLMEIESRMKNRISYGNTLGLKSTSQFILEQGDDLEKYICFIHIEDAEQIIQKYGNLAYDKLVMFNVEYIKEVMDVEYPKYNFNMYLYDHTSFYFTTDRKLLPERFISVARAIFNTCERQEYPIKFKNRFVVTVKGMMIHNLKKQAEYLSGIKENFFYVEEMKESVNQEINDDFKMVKTIQNAIENNEVIPYFQGIQDNKTNCFFCYEALMRIRDEHGKVLFPGDFMEISKKYNLYLKLSEKMIMKVLDLFGDRDEIITLNISYFDVISEEFVTKLFTKLDSMRRPGHFIFEIVETERIENPNVLREFIRRVKQYGIKVAVDDFGAGYSNFIEIGNLAIDYIKINGSLTQLLGTDISYEQILESISFMGKKMDVQLIAEFVETASMQKRLVSCGVHYSQGYLFSKPMSLDEMYIVSAENIEKQKNNENNEEFELKEITHNTNLIKRNNLIMFWGGIFLALLTLISILNFAKQNGNSTKEMSDSYLVEIATGMADKISVVMEDAHNNLVTISVALGQVYDDEVMLNETLLELQRLSDFSELYVSFDGTTAVNSYDEQLEVNIDEIYGVALTEQVAVHSPMIEEKSGRDILLLTSSIYDEQGIKIGEVIGKYYLDTFAHILALRSFGGEAFFHLCEVDGTAIVLSGDSNNLFLDGNMYTFIDSLDIYNGHTTESIRKDMEESNPVLLNYYVNDEERSAVMMRIPGTDWCVVSIVSSEVNDALTSKVTNDTLFFALGLAFMLFIYFIINMRLASQNRNDLMKALESSYFLTRSLQKSIETDTLTRTYSRSAAVEKITDAIHEIESTDKIQALVLLDVDNFKEINDRYGHQTGDIYLQDFVRAVRSVLRSDDILGRTGGDEFVLLLQNLSSTQETEEIVARIVEQVRNISIRNLEFEQVGVSIGVALVPEHGTDYEKLNHKADKALYKSKNEGKNKFNIYQDN